MDKPLISSIHAESIHFNNMASQTAVVKCAGDQRSGAGGAAAVLGPAGRWAR